MCNAQSATALSNVSPKSLVLIIQKWDTDAALFAAEPSRSRAKGAYTPAPPPAELFASNASYMHRIRQHTLRQDHVVPINKGGTHSIGNLVPACARCNESKSDWLLYEWLLKQRVGRPLRRRRANEEDASCQP